MKKNFSDFRSGLQEIHFQLMAQTINDLKIGSSIPSTEDDLQKFITSIATMNTILTLELLESYHDWLSRPE